jgi:DNA-binding beta-propeller fold protein YncE
VSIRFLLRAVPATVVVAVVAAGCSSQGPQVPTASSAATPRAPVVSRPATRTVHRAARVARQFRNPLPGMPAVSGADVYAAAAPGRLRRSVARDPQYLYVPNSYGTPTTAVIDQRTHKIVRVLRTGELSQHVTPSWDLRSLYVEASAANRLVQIDPRTGRVERRIPQRRPYNLYFTPDGRQGVVMAEQDDDIVFTDPHTFHRRAVVHDRSCDGPNHADFSANGRFLLVTCEFSGSLLEVSVLHHRVLGRLTLPAGSKPQDLRLSPDGRTFYVADMGRDRLLRIPFDRLAVVGHTDLPSMPHGIYPSRDGKYLYVSDRMAGEVSVVSVRTNRVVDTWSAPGGHPDMGGLSADGRTLWLTGRFDGHVFGWDTRTGRLVARIFVGGNPHGLLVWPQPGRYSLGHTGNMR